MVFTVALYVRWCRHLESMPDVKPQIYADNLPEFVSRAASSGQLACCELDRRLGACPVDTSAFWTPPDCWDAEDIALEMSDTPNIWTDGGREDFPLLVVLKWLALVFMLLLLSLLLRVLFGEVTEEYGDARLERCRAFMLVPGPIQTVQRSEFWVPSLLCSPAGLVTQVLITSMLPGQLAGLVKPLPLVKDGDLVALAQYMIQARGRNTVGVTKVKGHAIDADVEQGRVRLEDWLGNAEAAAAADLGRRHQSELLMDAWRILLTVRNHWYPIILQLHRFMIAVARVAVNHDGRGSTAPDPLVWDQGGRKRNVGRISGLMLILSLYLVLLVS